MLKAMLWLDSQTICLCLNSFPNSREWLILDRTVDMACVCVCIFPIPHFVKMNNIVIMNLWARSLTMEENGLPVAILAQRVRRPRICFRFRVHVATFSLFLSPPKIYIFIFIYILLAHYGWPTPEIDIRVTSPPVSSSPFKGIVQQWWPRSYFPFFPSLFAF